MKKQHFTSEKAVFSIASTIHERKKDSLIFHKCGWKSLLTNPNSFRRNGLSDPPVWTSYLPVIREVVIYGEAARLLNPPLVSQFKQLQLDCLESIYASKIAPVGQAKPPKIPQESIKKGFGIITEKGDSADILLYPSDCRMLHSMYKCEFLPPNSYVYEEVLPAGISNKCSDNAGEQLQEAFNESGRGESSVPLSSSCNVNKKKKEENELKSHFGFYQGGKHNCCEAQSEQKVLTEQKNLQKSLRNLLNISDSSYFKKFYFFLKSKLKDYPQNISVADFQEIVLNFGVCVTICKLRKLLIEFGLIDGCIEVFNAQSLVDALNWKSAVIENSEIKRSRFLESKKRVFGIDDISTDHFRVSCATGDHKYIESQKPAGIPSLRSDIKKPLLKSVADFTEYGDIKSGSCIIQPSVFEKNGIYDDDLCALRTKDEIISILHKSGICFQSEMVDFVWENLNKGGKASIGNVWNALKHIYLTENKVLI